LDSSLIFGSAPSAGAGFSTKNTNVAANLALNFK
jgi:hypothetical protein